MGPGASWLMCNGTIGEDYACDPQVTVWVGSGGRGGKGRRGCSSRSRPEVDLTKNEPALAREKEREAYIVFYAILDGNTRIV